MGIAFLSILKPIMHFVLFIGNSGGAEEYKDVMFTTHTSIIYSGHDSVFPVLQCHASERPDNSMNMLCGERSPHRTFGHQTYDDML